MGMSPRNSSWGAVRICGIATLVGAGFAVVPWMIGANMMRWGFAAALVGGMVAAVGLVMTYLFWCRAELVDRIIRGSDVLAHWTYDGPEWREYWIHEYEEEVGMRKFGVRFLSVAFLLAGVFLAVLVGKDFATILGIVLGFIALFNLVEWLIPTMNPANPRGDEEVFITAEGVLLNGVLFSWNALGARLERIERQSPEFVSDMKSLDGLEVLTFTYSYPSRRGRHEDACSAPIPASEREKVPALMSRLEGLVKAGENDREHVSGV